MTSRLAHISPALRYWFGAVAIVAYVAFIYWRGGLGWQHLGLSAIIWACLTSVPGPRRFVGDWWPMIAFWLSYDVMRVFSSALLHRVAVEQPFRWESALFLSPEGVIWPFYFVHWAARHFGQFWPAVLRRYLDLVYLSQIFAIPLVFMGIWARRRGLLFKRLVWCFTALHVMALIIYISYPAAPPWWVYENGFVQPSPAHSRPLALGSSLLSGLFRLNPNRFAAVPSLHGAYPLLLTLVLAFHGVRIPSIVLAGAYTASMWFACVFLNQHYIVDLLLGALLLPIALIPARFVKDQDK